MSAKESCMHAHASKLSILTTIWWQSKQEWVNQSWSSKPTWFWTPREHINPDLEKLIKELEY